MTSAKNKKKTNQVKSKSVKTSSRTPGFSTQALFNRIDISLPAGTAMPVSSISPEALQNRLDEIRQNMLSNFAQQNYEAALTYSLEAHALIPQSPHPLSDAAANCIYLNRWQQAIGYAKQALTLPNPPFAVYDSLAHAYGHLHTPKAQVQVRHFGLLALKKREQQFQNPPLLEHALPVLPPLPHEYHQRKNLIAMSLFGAQAKYCETAIINAELMPDLYPDWCLCIYVDDTVPRQVINRLRQLKTWVIPIGSLQVIPGPMWRFLALDLPRVHRVVFRDADSVISLREVHAVNEWLHGSTHFHVMRDAVTHTELILAGLWGAVAGALPPMLPMIQAFLTEPVKSRHFADQYFLREYIWPFARQSLMQHDGLFNFEPCRPFPDGPTDLSELGFHVGMCDAFMQFKMSLTPDYSVSQPVYWQLLKADITTAEQAASILCEYQSMVKAGPMIEEFLPRALIAQIHDKTLKVQISKQPLLNH